MRNKANRKIIRRMLVIVSLIAAGLLAAFWMISYGNLEARVERSIQAFVYHQSRYYEDPTTFAVFELYLGEEQELLYPSPLEEDMIAYFQEHPDQLVLNTIQRYGSPGLAVWYCPMKFVNLGLERPAHNPEYLLLYCDIGYEVQLLNSNVLVIVAVLAGFILLLFVVSRNTLKALDKKDTEMKNFFANASHELKTPLMAIKGNVDGIRNGYVAAEAGCEVIEKESDRMSGLISSILDISRLDSGMVEPDMVRTDVREIIYDAVSSVLQEAEHRKLKIEVDLPEPVFRNCDERMLYSAFSNIMTNDIRYADSFIRISANPIGDQVCFRFENDGTPISEEDREHIFDRFYKGERGQNGIGMALAQEYVKLHGSRIEVHAGENRTIFEIVM